MYIRRLIAQGLQLAERNRIDAVTISAYSGGAVAATTVALLMVDADSVASDEELCAVLDALDALALVPPLEKTR